MAEYGTKGANWRWLILTRTPGEAGSRLQEAGAAGDNCKRGQ